MDIERKAEIRLLADLVNNPNRIFDTTAVLRDTDFSFFGTRCLYVSVKKIAEKGNVLTKDQPITKEALEQKVAEVFPQAWKKQQKSFEETLDSVYQLKGLNAREFRSAVDFVLKNSISKQAVDKLERVRKEVEAQKAGQSHNEILSHVESEIFNFTTNAIDGSDIVVLGSEYETFLAQREKAAQAGNLRIGIDTGFPELNKAIGGGFRRATINVFAARAKMGKSWWGLKIADNVAKQRIPVLYLDSELEDNYQADRRCSQHTKIPIHQLEKAGWMNKPEWQPKIQNALNYFERYPIYYVDIKGWSIDRQISVIRKFFAKHVGRQQDGTYHSALVVLDYLKLMRAGDKGADKEWEALGYRMTLLHDLMGEYDGAMLALCQQNREGLERDNEATVAGSDRIIWLCDNFSVLSPIPAEEVALHQDDVAAGTGTQHGNLQVRVPNTKLNVVVCRHGPGTPGGYIAYYFDIRDKKLGHDQVSGHIEESTRRINIVTQPAGTSGSKP